MLTFILFLRFDLPCTSTGLILGQKFDLFQPYQTELTGLNGASNNMVG